MDRQNRVPEQRVLVTALRSPHDHVEVAERRAAAELLRRFAAGEITNRELERQWPRSSDVAVEQVRLVTWHLYDDLREHRHEGDAADDLLRRCADFLQTDSEYGWPIPNRWLVVASIPLSVLTLGLVNRVLWRKYRFPDYWPFLSRAECERARTVQSKGVKAP